MSAATAPTSVYSAAAPGSATLPFPSASAKRSICTPSACSTISMLSVKSQAVRGLLHLLPHDVVEEEKIILKPSCASSLLDSSITLAVSLWCLLTVFTLDPGGVIAIPGERPDALGVTRA